MVELYLYFPIRLHGIIINEAQVQVSFTITIVYHLMSWSQAFGVLQTDLHLLMEPVLNARSLGATAPFNHLMSYNHQYHHTRCLTVFQH
jgi:hypothetical protein